jgi:hypothetical protein
MENKIVTRSLRRQLDQVLLHEQVGNGTAINNNLNANQEDQQFVTSRKVSESEHRHMWIKEKLTSHKTL